MFSEGIKVDQVVVKKAKKCFPSLKLPQMRCFRPFRVSSFRSVPFSPLVRQLHTSIPKRSHVWQNKELVSLVKDVKSMGPIFPAKSENFTFVKGPVEFYNELKVFVLKCNPRLQSPTLKNGLSFLLCIWVQVGTGMNWY